MRVFITLLALVTAPFLASVSQEPAGSPSRTDNDAVRHSEAGKVEDQDNDDGDAHCWSGEHDAAWATHSQGHGHHWAKGHAKHACAPLPPPSTTCTVGTGMAEIDGMSWSDVNGNTWQDNPVSEPGQAGWTIELICGGTVVATRVTGDGTTAPLGTYAFKDLSDGTYLVCEVEPPHTGWGQTSPMTARACAPFDLSPSGLTWSSAGRTPTGYGYTVVVPPGLVAPQTWLANDFGNKTP